MFQILEKRWSKLTLRLINEWLNIALDYTRTSNCPDIRKIFFLGLKNLMNISESHMKLIEFLPDVLESIHDTNVDVKSTVLELILLFQRKIDIKIWDRIPLHCFIECLDVSYQTVNELKKVISNNFISQTFFYISDNYSRANSTRTA